MTSRGRWIAICFGLAAWFWYTVGAFAQEAPASAQPERYYKIELMSFEAREESGIDWLGSDEVMVYTVAAKGWTVSEEIGNIDSGDTHHFDPAKSCIVSVRPGIVLLGRTSVCNGVGVPAPLWFRVELWEKDPLEFPPTADFCGPGGPIAPDAYTGPHCPDDQRGDDILGVTEIDLSTNALETILGEVGSSHIETVVLHPCFEPICGGDLLARYAITYRVTRLPDDGVGVGPGRCTSGQTQHGHCESGFIGSGYDYRCINGDWVTVGSDCEPEASCGSDCEPNPGCGSECEPNCGPEPC